MVKVKRNGQKDSIYLNIKKKHMYITEKKLIKWALYSNVLYIFLILLLKPDGISIQKILITSLLVFSVISLFYISFISRKLLKELPKFTRSLLGILILYGCIIIIRSFSFSFQDWITNFGNVYMAFAWLVPIVLILGLKIKNWTIIFKAIRLMFLFMALGVLLLPFYEEITTEWTWLLRPVNFVLLVSMAHYGFNKRVTIYIIIIIYIIVAIKVQQRMEFLFLTLVLGLLTIDKLFSIKLKRSFLKYILTVFIVVFIVVFTLGYEFISSIIASFVDFQDTRVFLFTELFEELSKTNDKLFGRGSLGTYYSQFFYGTRMHYLRVGNNAWVGDSPNRITTEVGYLQMILKGGFTLLILNITIVVNAVYLALFRSKSQFIKRLGYYILVISILSLVSFRPAFTPTFIIFWMAIGTVLSKKNRMMSDKKIKKLIKFK